MPVGKKQPRERRSAGRQAEPVATKDTKKDIEARQQALKQVNQQRAADNIEAHDKEKLENPRSICETHTLVAGSSGSSPEKVPDLSEWWVTRSPINFIAFLPQDNTGWYGDGGNATMEEREQVVQFANEDCSKLLKLPHHQFWSHVVHNTAFGRFKDTYLRHATRYFDGEWTAAAALGADAAAQRGRCGGTRRRGGRQRSLFLDLHGDRHPLHGGLVHGGHGRRGGPRRPARSAAAALVSVAALVIGGPFPEVL